MRQGSALTQVRKPSRAFGVIALVLIAIAFVVFVIPMVKFAQAELDDGVSVGSEPVTVYAPPDHVWGLYVYDPDNSGYYASCRVTDAEGSLIELRGPGVSISSSEYESLDQEFTTPDEGSFIVSCDVRGATVRVAPVGDLRALLIGVALGGVLGFVGLVAGSLWLARRKTSYVRSRTLLV